MYKRAIVFGAYNPIHFGHIRLLERTAKIASKVYAITESDAILRSEKLVEPYTTQSKRVKDLEGIKYVTKAYCRTKSKDRLYWVKKLKPDVLILGSDYKTKDWIGKTYGIKIVYLPRTPDISSTLLRNKLK
jgi:glycerol-3-phosphate cytidylyltransferase